MGFDGDNGKVRGRERENERERGYSCKIEKIRGCVFKKNLIK